MTRGVTRSTRRGLTLLELLAAVVILSAVAAAFASITQDASRTLREAHTDPDSRADALAARLALALWERSHPALAADLAALARDADERETLVERAWEFLDHEGARWMIHASAQPLSTHTDRRETEETWTQRVALVSLSITPGNGQGATLTTRRLAPLPAHSDERSAP